MSSGVNPYEHVKRRAKMLKKSLKQIKAWRTKGLPFEVAFSKLVSAKLLPRFSYGFGLIPVTRWSKAHIEIQKTLDAALKQAVGWSFPKGTILLAGVWFAICGHPSVLGFLRQEKLLMAARLKIAQTKAGRIFRGLFGHDNGTFERDVSFAVKGWLLGKDWLNLDENNILEFKKKVKRRARKCWPHGLRRDGNLKWLYHNHCVYSGNVPYWADWKWPDSDRWGECKFKQHFCHLLLGSHPAGGSTAICLRKECVGNNLGPIFEHHFFICENHIKNREFFRSAVNRLFIEGKGSLVEVPKDLVNSVLCTPCPMWVGLMDVRIFEHKLKLFIIHELHRILTVASILSWGRFYALPKEYLYNAS